MSGNCTVVIPETVLEEFHCCLCEGYLSCSPVRVLPDGTCICGRCSLLNNDTPVYRILALEAVLSRISFPCRFKQHGCVEFVRFDKAFDHESKCTFRFFSCPLVPHTTCNWKGMITNIHDHFNQKHAGLIVRRAEFKVQVDKDIAGISLVVVDGVVFIVKYEYNANDGNLRYNIRHCKNELAQNVSYNIKLVNEADADCSISLKISKCLQFDDNFYNTENASVLNLNKFLQCLDNPNHIIVVFNLQVRNVSHSTVTERNCIDYDLLNSLRCHKCQEYLTPPLYLCDSRIICSECAKNNPEAVPSPDTQLEELVAETNYPCRWRDCTFVGKSIIVKGHELSCQFRYYSCLFKDCGVTFKLSSAIAHFQCHRAIYLPKIVYKTTFVDTYIYRHIFTIKGSTIISVEYSVIDLSKRTHRVSVHSSNVDGIRASLDFEHKHCKLKSKIFTIESGKELDVTLDELPRCFKADEQLTITVDIL